MSDEIKIKQNWHNIPATESNLSELVKIVESAGFFVLAIIRSPNGLIIHATDKD